jgi:hypothetical protein
MRTVIVLRRLANIGVGALLCVSCIHVACAKTPTAASGTTSPQASSGIASSSDNSTTAGVLKNPPAPSASKAAAAQRPAPEEDQQARTTTETASLPHPDNENSEKGFPYAAIAATFAVFSVLLGIACLLLIVRQRSNPGKRTARDDGSEIAAAVERALKRHMTSLMDTTTQGFARIERSLEAQRTAAREEPQREVRAMPPDEPSPSLAPTPTRASVGRVASPAARTRPSAPLPAAPPVARVDLAALLPAVKQAIRTVAESGSSITSANVLSRVSASIPSEVTRGELSRAGMSIELFDGDGRPSVQAAQLMAIRFEALNNGTRLVFPFPYAGKVARFVYWFGQGDYHTDPVLAEVPAMAEVGSDGTLQMTKNGSLRKT